MLATQNRFVIKYFNRVPPDRPGWLRNYVSRRELYKMAQPEFEVLQLFSVTPRANRGVMHIVNSRKVNWPIRALFGDRVEKLKERLGLGWTLMLLARKKTVGSTSGAEKETTALLWEARGGPKGFEPCRPA